MRTEHIAAVCRPISLREAKLRTNGVIPWDPADLRRHKRNEWRRAARQPLSDSRRGYIITAALALMLAAVPQLFDVEKSFYALPCAVVVVFLAWQLISIPMWHETELRDRGDDVFTFRMSDVDASVPPAVAGILKRARAALRPGAFLTCVQYVGDDPVLILRFKKPHPAAGTSSDDYSEWLAIAVWDDGGLIPPPQH